LRDLILFPINEACSLRVVRVFFFFFFFFFCAMDDASKLFCFFLWVKSLFLRVFF